MGACQSRDAVQSCCCCFCVPQSSIGVVTNCGKYEGLAAPGCHCVDPCRIGVAGTMSLRTQNRVMRVQSKTKENVFVTLTIEIHFQVLPGAIDVAFYYLESPNQRIENYVSAYIRAAVPLYTMDELYLERQAVATEVKTNVDIKMDEFGYDILAVLIIDIVPDAGIQNIMNQLLVSRRLEIAEKDSAAAECILRLKRAEASAELKRLSAVGVANQRREVLKGLEFSVDTMREALPTYNDDELLHMLLTVQYLDTIKEIAAQGGSHGTSVAGGAMRAAADGQGVAAEASAQAAQAAAEHSAMGNAHGSPTTMSGNHLVTAESNLENETSKYERMYAEPHTMENILALHTQYAKLQQLTTEIAKLKASLQKEATAAKAFELSNANDNNSTKKQVGKGTDHQRAVFRYRANQLASQKDALYMPHVTGLKGVAKQLFRVAKDAVPAEAQERAAAVAGMKARMQLQ